MPTFAKWIILLCLSVVAANAQEKRTAGKTESAPKAGTPAAPAAPVTPATPAPAPQVPTPAPAARSTSQPTIAELQTDVLQATIALSILIVVAACVVCGILVWRINKHQAGLTEQQLQNALAGLPTRQQVQDLVGTLPTRQQVQDLVGTLPTRQQMQDAIVPLATLAQVQAALTPIATQAQLQGALTPVATQQQLLAATANLATQQQLQAAVTPLATAAAQQVSDRTLQTLSEDITRLNQDIALLKGSNDSVLSMLSHLVPGAPPRITAIEPTSGRTGAAMVVWGSNFQANSRVWFGTTPAQPVETTENMLRVVVPQAVSGDVNLHVQGLNGISAPYRFTVAA